MSLAAGVLWYEGPALGRQTSQGGAPAETQAANLSGLAHLNPLLGFVQLRGGPGTVARHLPAAQRADDGVSMPTTSA